MCVAEMVLPAQSRNESGVLAMRTRAISSSFGDVKISHVASDLSWFSGNDDQYENITVL